MVSFTDPLVQLIPTVPGKRGKIVQGALACCAQDCGSAKQHSIVSLPQDHHHGETRFYFFGYQDPVPAGD